MYTVKTNGALVGYADSVTFIRLHKNGCYVPCTKEESEGFCAKLAVETEEGTTLDDCVFTHPGKTIRGTEPEGTFETVSGAMIATDAELAAKILLGEEEA